MATEASLLTRRRFEESRQWEIVLAYVESKLGEYHRQLIDAGSWDETCRLQGAVKELLTMRDELPRSLPDEFVDGKPVEDIVAVLVRRQDKQG